MQQGQRAGSFSEDFREVGPRCAALGRDLGPALSTEKAAGSTTTPAYRKPKFPKYAIYYCQSLVFGI